MRRIFDLLGGELSRIVISLCLFLIAFIHGVLSHSSFSLASLILYVCALLIAGMPVFFDAVRGILRRDLLDEKFLMSIASIGAVIIGEAMEGAAVMIFFLVGEYFEHKAVARSRKSIKSLLDICADEARVLLPDGSEEEMDSEDVEVGSIISVRAGERIPLDSVVICGVCDIDTSALTGESMPISVTEGDSVSAGCVVIGGVLTAKTVRIAEESAASRILSLVEDATERKSKAENFITKFSRVYTPIVVSLALLIAVILPIFSLASIPNAIYRALIFLVISCPCALVISVPMSFFGGIGASAARGILYKGANTFSALARADSFAFDKTGTLTTGEFSVSEILPSGITEQELIYLAATAEYHSNHPIANCIKSLSQNIGEPTEISELSGRGMKILLDGKCVLVGNDRLLSESGIKIPEEKNGAVYVAQDGKYVGMIIVSDTIRPEARRAVERLRAQGAKRLVMLSGDRRENAERVGQKLTLDEVYAPLTPEEKFSKLEEIIEQSNSTVYIGDGINDSPSIARADVGACMGGIGADSSIEVADLVIMSDNPERLVTAQKIARKTVRISTENIVFALGVKIFVMILGALGIANMWLAVFADVGVAVLAILNAMRTMYIGE